MRIDLFKSMPASVAWAKRFLVATFICDMSLSMQVAAQCFGLAKFNLNQTVWLIVGLTTLWVSVMLFQIVLLFIAGPEASEQYLKSQTAQRPSDK